MDSAARRWILLLLVLGVCAVLRIASISGTAVIARDGMRYVGMAQQWRDDPAATVRTNDYHVGYPAAMAAVHAVAGRLGGGDSLRSWELSGQCLSFAAAMLALAGVYTLARSAFADARVALVAVLLFGLGRKWVELGCDVLSDAPAMCLQIWAIVLAMRVCRVLAAASAWSLLLAAVVGLLAGLGYLVRPEALLAGGAAVTLWVWSSRGGQGIAPSRRRWAMTAASAAVAVAVAAACALPYALAIGGLTRKKAVGDLLSVIGGNASPSMPLASIGSFGNALAGVGNFIRQLIEAMHPVVAVLVVIFLLTYAMKSWLSRRLFPIVPQPQRMYSAMLLIVGFLTMSLLVLLYAHAGYISHRHTMFLAAVTSPLCGAGAVWLAEVLSAAAARLRVRKKVRKYALIVVVGGIALALGGHSWGPLHGDKAHHRKAAQWVRAHVPRDVMVLTDSVWIAYYAREGGRNVVVDTIADERVRQYLSSSRAVCVVSGRRVGKDDAPAAQMLNGAAFVPACLFVEPHTRRPEVVCVYRQRAPGR